MSLYATCPCGIPEGLDMVHLRTDCPHYGASPMTDTPPAGLVAVEQCDRDAAANLAQWLINASLAWSEDYTPFFVAEFPQKVREGIWDNHDWAQAFARHRIKATRAMGVEIQNIREVRDQTVILAKEYLARATKAEAKLEAMREAAQVLVDKLDEVAPHISGQTAYMLAHGIKYDGPNYGEELKSLRQALSREGGSAS
jgi:hypothetical protein